jgi:hypothetical protein
MGSVQHNVAIINKKLTQACLESSCNLIDLRVFQKMHCFETVFKLNYIFKVTCSVETLRDLTNSVEIKASSRQAMIGSLTDNSTETFWESGDEDR